MRPRRFQPEVALTLKYAAAVLTVFLGILVFGDGELGTVLWLTMLNLPASLLLEQPLRAIAAAVGRLTGTTGALIAFEVTALAVNGGILWLLRWRWRRLSED